MMPALPAMRLDKNANDSPHVVILGAGASVASFLRGDRHGRRLPVMANFVEVLGLEDLIRNVGVDASPRNFEEIYDTLAGTPDKVTQRRALEDAVAQYFGGMEIGDEVTLYDELILSLREKDLIATFNWDPLLLQAYRRHVHFGHLPRLAFLHG